MPIQRLEISDFRNITSIQLEPLLQGFNVIYGYNGSGKTSILEAIYYLSLGRSFRSSLTSRIIRYSANKLAVFAQLMNHTNQMLPIGVERHQDGTIKMRMSGKDVHSAAELAMLTPAQLINSSCFNLLEAPVFRRKYLDWGCFYQFNHQANHFLYYWRLFVRALRQRNAALRGQLSKQELSVWTRELILNALRIDQIRTDYTHALLPILQQVVADLLPIKNLELTYQRGWDSTQDYEEILSASLEKDQQLGRTHYGPHRADFKINIDKVPAKDILSRGQQKLFICAMLLAQGILLHNQTNTGPIYLIDDLPSELDIQSRSRLMTLLAQLETQIFVTAVERATLEDLAGRNLKMFHVEHGKLIDVTERQSLTNIAE